MGLPTILVPGSLRAKGVDPTEIPLKFIQRWVKRRMPEFGGTSATMADRVLIVRAETGSGKSTALPVGMFRILRSERTPPKQRFRGPGVICTQPRVLTAIALATDVSSERIVDGVKTRINPDMILSMTVGFQTGPLSDRPPSGLVYATAGVLAVQLRHQEDAEIMERYRFILMDEAHERSLDSDMTLMLLLNFYKRNLGNERLPFLLLTSATFDTTRYAKYFGVGPENIVEVVGRSHEITTHWPKQGANDYLAEAASQAVKIHEAGSDDPPEQADILIFVPGVGEMKTVERHLRKVLLQYAANEFKDHPPFLTLLVNREVVISQIGDYPLVFVPPEKLPAVEGHHPSRRIIVANVVAETGLTIDTLRYVIECGWSRTREVYQPWGVDGITTRPAPQSRIRQRKGRAGRMFPGDFYPLYTKNVFEALDTQQLPDIITTGVTDILLIIVREQQRQKLRMGQVPEFRVEDMALLDPPATEAFLSANSKAISFGFISPRAPLPDRWPPASLENAMPDEPGASGSGPLTVTRGYGLTPLGHIAAMFSRVPTAGVRILLSGYVWGAAASDLATAVATFGVSMKDLLVDRGRPAKGSSPMDLPPGSDALRAALPSFLVERVGGGVTGALPPTESEAFYFRARLLIADDFIETVLIFDLFMRQLGAARGDLATVAEWCTGLGLEFDGLIALARYRESVIEEMIVAGLNPYRAPERRLATLSAEDFTEGVTRFKRCMYDGLRSKLLRYEERHPKGPGYYTKQDLKVRTPDLFTDALANRLRALRVTSGSSEMHPKWILTDQVRLMPAPRKGSDKDPPLLYIADTNRVSVMDGYVDPDPNFDAPREFS